MVEIGWPWVDRCDDGPVGLRERDREYIGRHRWSGTPPNPVGTVHWNWHEARWDKIVEHRSSPGQGIVYAYSAPLS